MAYIFCSLEISFKSLNEIIFKQEFCFGEHYYALYRHLTFRLFIYHRVFKPITDIRIDKWFVDSSIEKKVD